MRLQTSDLKRNRLKVSKTAIKVTSISIWFQVDPQSTHYHANRSMQHRIDREPHATIGTTKRINRCGFPKFYLTVKKRTNHVA